MGVVVGGVSWTVQQGQGIADLPGRIHERVRKRINSGLREKVEREGAGVCHCISTSGNEG